MSFGSCLSCIAALFFYSVAVALGRWNTNRKRHPPNIALQFSFTRSGGSRREEKEIPEQCDLVAAFENDILGRRTEGRQRVIGVKEREGGRGQCLNGRGMGALKSENELDGVDGVIEIESPTECPESWPVCVQRFNQYVY